MKWRTYPEYKELSVNWPGEIPTHWETKRVKRVFDVINGSTPRSSEPAYWDGSIPWATPNDLGKLAGDTILKTERLITREGYESCGTKLVPAGSLVLSTRAPIGHLAIAGMNLCTNQGCRALAFCSEEDARFFYYQLLAARPNLESLGRGSTFLELGRDELEFVLLAYPPFTEQHTIAAFLDRKTAHIDTLIAKKERQIELLQEKRAALISHAVTKGLDPDVPMKDSGVEWLGEIPAHWQIQKLKHIAFVKVSNVDKHTKEEEQPVYLCNYTDVYYNDYITSDLEFMKATASLEEIRKFALREKDIIVTKDSETWDDIAVPSYVPSELEGVLCGYHLALIRPDSNTIDGEYLFRSFLAPRINDQFKVAATGITRYGLGKHWLDNSFFLVPPIVEQRAIAAFLDRQTAHIDTLIAKIQESITTLHEYRTALISAAVTGKIDVRET